MLTKSVSQPSRKAYLPALLAAMLVLAMAWFSTPPAVAAGQPTALAVPASLTVHQLSFNGVHVVGENYAPNLVLTPAFDGVAVADIVAVTDGQGKLDFGYARENVAPGMHTLSFAAGSISTSASFTVTPDPVPTVVLTPSSISSADLAAVGVRAEGSAFSNYRIVEPKLEGRDGGGFLTDGQGGFSQQLRFAGVAAGQRTLTFTDEAGKTATATLTVTGEVPAAPQVAFEPSTISTSALADTGTQISGRGFPANLPVEILYDHSGTMISTVQADDQGRISYLLKDTLVPGEAGIIFRSGAVYAQASLTVTADPETTGNLGQPGQPADSGQAVPAVNRIAPAAQPAAGAAAELQPVAGTDRLAATGANDSLPAAAGLLVLLGTAAVFSVRNRPLARTRKR
ncbi:MAG: LPXTG cell wall anchor domain-containing protein [Renibacterium sp.]|nr:LPXTG cell wall anchor domain-containing protein [Renibacterium sp.]